MYVCMYVHTYNTFIFISLYVPAVSMDVATSLSCCFDVEVRVITFALQLQSMLLCL